MHPKLLSLVENHAEAEGVYFEQLCQQASRDELEAMANSLEAYRHEAGNFYHRVRAILFLAALHRYHLASPLGRLDKGAVPDAIPYAGYKHALDRRYEEAISLYLAARSEQRANPGAAEGHADATTHASAGSCDAASQKDATCHADALSSALASAYYGLAFKTLAQQVQKTVRRVRGNQWMFRAGHPADYPLRIRPELRQGSLLCEQTSVRLDLSHAAWSDIFFLGMDYPEGARVLNISIDLGVHGRDDAPRPPVCGYLRVIDVPVLRLTSVDLGATADIASIDEVFDFAKDYLGLLKAAVIAAGIVPPGLEGSGHALSELLSWLVGPGKGLEIVSQVRDIPKGSRLAVSTNLLGCLIALCMRATGQVASLQGGLTEEERRTIASRAILGEWLGGSGGGWQDSGGIWPGIKLIAGELAETGDTEHGTSRGRLLPRHRLFGTDAVSEATRAELQASLVLVHGGMSQNVGPILEMVTEKYLLKLEREWAARREAQEILHAIVAALQAGDVRRVAELTTRNFFGPIQAIIPWASNAYTERLIAEIRAELGPAYRGFIMLGGMSGGGMGFWIDPSQRAAALPRILDIMRRTKRLMEQALPFAMDPVVYDFSINERGSQASLATGSDALLPPEYYLFMVPRWLRQDPRKLPASARAELERFASRQLFDPTLSLHTQLLKRLFPETSFVAATAASAAPAAPAISAVSAVSAVSAPRETLLQPAAKKAENFSGCPTPAGNDLQSLLAANGFDPVQHEKIREDLRAGRIGLSQNRLAASIPVADVRPGDVDPVDPADPSPADLEAGIETLRSGTVAVVTLAAGAGSRWTQGAGTVKALHPFARLAGSHRSFLEVHLAKSRRAMERHGAPVPHVFTTSHLTHAATAAFLDSYSNFGYPGPLFLSRGRSIGLRMVPMARDLRFAFEEMPHQRLDPQKEKMRQSLHKALLEWAVSAGEASDYTDNLPSQCLHPVGHWYEVANLLLNGTLRELLRRQPGLRYLLLHNIDTLGASLDPALLGRHARSGATLSVEVIRRRIEDRGGGLARVGTQLRLVEGLALAREEDEFRLSYYNSATTWMSIDPLLACFGVTRATLDDAAAVTEGVRALAARMPTYVTLKEVKKRWGNGQEDIFPVTQFEKLWGDMTSLPDLPVRFLAVPRFRGQQLKDQAQLDGWLRDGSAAGVEALAFGART